MQPDSDFFLRLSLALFGTAFALRMIFGKWMSDAPDGKVSLPRHTYWDEAKARNKAHRKQIVRAQRKKRK